MKCSWKSALAGLLLSVSPLLISSGWAQTQQAPSVDDGSNGVARISLVNGDVSVRRGDSGEIVAAAANVPMTVQDSLLTGSGGAAEIQFDSANMIRLGQNSEVRLADLAYGRAQLQIATGTVMFRVLETSTSQIEIDTPQVSVRPTAPGSYRITIRPDGTSEIIVRSGRADIFTPRGSQPLEAGQMMVARGTASDPEFQIEAPPAPDDWDRWNADRDQYFERARSSDQYVNPDIYGTEDLADNGQWVDSEYGRAWHPRVDPDWAPYRYGHWGWVNDYGWSWLSDDPWGWAPYHYGNWFYDAPVGWCWYPGAYSYPHYYWSPALVGFVGFGGGFGGGFGFGVGFGFGNIGWFPVAPFEPFYPWWGRGFFGGFNRTIINNTTIVNNVNITNIYRNVRVTNGVTAVNAAQFGNLHAPIMRPTAAALQGANLVRGQVPVAPSRQSLQFANRAVNTANLPHTPANRTFFAHQQPRPIARPAFAQQQRSMQQVVKQILTARPQPASALNMPNRTPAPGWRPATGATGLTPRNPAPQPNSAQAGNGWRRFGGTSGGPMSAPQPNNARISPNRPVSPAPQNGAASSLRSPAGGSGWRSFGAPKTGTMPFNRTSPAPMNQNWNAPRAGVSGNTASSGGGSRQFGGPSGSLGSPAPSRPAPSYRPSSPNPSYRPAPFYNPRPSYNSGGAQRPSPSYQGGGAYQSRPAPSYRPSPSSNGGGGYRPSPSYGGGSYRPSPSYQRAAPSYRPSPSSNGGGGYRPSPSYGGGSYRPSPSYQRPAPSYRPSPPSNGVGAYRPTPSSGGGSNRPSPSYGGGGSHPSPTFGGGSYHSSPSVSGGGGSYNRGGGSYHASDSSHSSGPS